MTITAKTYLVIFGMIFCILFAGIRPYPATFVLVTLIGTVLIVYLIYAVLTDDYIPSKESIGPEPGYRK